MRFGTVHSFQDPPGSPVGHRAVYEAGLEQIVRSEELGYHWVSLTEHHVSDDGYGPAVLTVLGALATATRALRLSTGMLVLTLHHPIRVAEEAAVIDVLSGGRLTLGVSVGYRRLEFDALGIDYTTRGRRFEESVEIMLRAWSGESFEFHGEIFEIPLVTVRPRPLQQPHPPLWIGGTSDRALRRGVRYDSALFPGATDPGAAIEERQRRYRELRSFQGLDGGFDLVVPRLALVADSVEEARRRAYPAISAMFERYRSWGGPPALAGALRDWSVLDELVIVGDEERCAERVERYRALGVSDLMLHFAMPTLEPALAAESMERFGAAFVPRETA